MKLRTLFLFVVIALTNVYASPRQKSQIHIVDIWNGRPIPSALLYFNHDTLKAAPDGTIALKFDCLPMYGLQIKARGYFPENLRCKDIKDGIVYLTPVEQTPFITVVRSQIPSQPLNIPSHQTHLTVDPSFYEGQTIADLLQTQSSVFVKSYGPPEGLKTIAVRGMAAEQTQVSFDGIPLNNLQLGSVDLGQFSLENLSGIDLYRGSNVILGGSGAIGGSINLIPMEPNRSLTIKGRLAYATLKNKNLAFQLHLPFPQMHLRSLLTIEHANGLNRFSILNQGEKVELKNRDFRRNDLSYQLIFEPSNLGQFKFFVSHFKRHAGAPKAFTNLNSEKVNHARISSDNTLSYLRWQYETKRLGYYAQIYARNEWMTYFDPELLVNFIPLHSKHFDKEQGLQVRFHYSPRQALLFKSGVEMANQSIVSSDAGKHKRRRQAFYLLSDWLVFENSGTLQAFHLNAGFRVEHYDAHSAVILPSIGASFNHKLLEIYANAGRNFRIPGFNDLYWRPGGNPRLKPEFSHNFEIGTRQRIPLRQWLGQIEISAYQNLVNNQIRWFPGKSGYWTPENIRSVESRGVEIDIHWAHVNNIHKIHFSYSFGRTLKKKAEMPNDDTVGNQVPFLPQEQWALNVQSGWKRWRFGFDVQRTGFRYTDFSNDPNNILPSFTTARLWLRSKVVWMGLDLLPGITLENVTNRSYEVLKGFPMPGRYVSINCNIVFSTGKSVHEAAPDR